MTTIRRILALCLATLIFALPAGVARADDDDESSSGGDHNAVTAVNTRDGASVFRFALAIERVHDGVVDQTNTATAHASCVDCTTVAVAFQVVLVYGDVDVVAPENRAEAANVECQECLTYAAATQIVVDMDGKELSPNGKRRLRALEKRMREVERNAENMSDAELLAATQEAERELLAIFQEELVPIGGAPPSSTTTTTSTTTTSTTSRSTTTTTTTTTVQSTTTTASAA